MKFPSRAGLAAISIVSVATVLGLACVAAAAPTQDEVFRSIHQNVGSTTDLRKLLPWIMGCFGLVILLVIVNQRRQRVVTPKTLNHTGKLLKEISRGIALRSVEIKQLKILADEQEVSSPLTLLLCPSVLNKAMRSKNPRLDRKVLWSVVQRLRQRSGHSEDA